MHSFQTLFPSNSAISEAHDHSTFVAPARNTAGSFSNATDLAFLIILQSTASPGGMVLSVLAFLHTRPMKNLTLTSGMTNVKSPSWTRHFNMSPGSCFNCSGISSWMSKAKWAPLSPQNWFLVPVIMEMPDHSADLKTSRPFFHSCLPPSPWCCIPHMHPAPPLSWPPTHSITTMLLDYFTRIYLLFLPFFTSSLTLLPD